MLSANLIRPLGVCELEPRAAGPSRDGTSPTLTAFSRLIIGFSHAVTSSPFQKTDREGGFVVVAVVCGASLKPVKLLLLC